MYAHQEKQRRSRQSAGLIAPARVSPAITAQGTADLITSLSLMISERARVFSRKERIPSEELERKARKTLCNPAECECWPLAFEREVHLLTSPNELKTSSWRVF